MSPFCLLNQKKNLIQIYKALTKQVLVFTISNQKMTF